MKYRGFTLIELLVVIAIIGLLSSIVLASLNTARDKAKDAQRRSALNEVRNALILYYDEHGTYAVAGTGYTGSGTGFLTAQDGSTYAKSVVQGLVDAKFLGGTLSDPDVEYPRGAGGGHGTYMIYANTGGLTKGVCLFSYLSNPTAADAASFAAAPAATVTMVQGSNYLMKTALCF